ncbi:hypothetical protein F4777DRAFT_58829 [Nemania sp. FL0916]|nr:hypothetical protein F4777DRAFT_58829 [Nemania sp. FL0916]
MMSQSQNNGSRLNSGSPPNPDQQRAEEASSASTEAQMAQAFRDLARGEQQAAAIEAHLASFESKLDALLASIEAGSDAAKVDAEENKTSNKKPTEEK